MAGDITGVQGINVGHYTDRSAATGCTIVMCEDGAVGGVSVRGSAPGTRETDLLRPTRLVSSPCRAAERGQRLRVRRRLGRGGVVIVGLELVDLIVSV